MKEGDEKLKLLFVSNDPELKPHVEQCLSEYVAQKKFSSFEDGLFVFREFSPEIIFVDFISHLEKSISFLKEVEKNFCTDGVSFIIIIGIDERIRMEALANTKPYDFLMKPFFKAELLKRIEINKKVLKLQSQLRENERLKGMVKISRKIGHDINNPLTTVIGISDLMLEDKMDEQHIKMIGIIRKESLKIAALVEEMMTASDSERGR